MEDLGIEPTILLEPWVLGPGLLDLALHYLLPRVLFKEEINRVSSRKNSKLRMWLNYCLPKKVKVRKYGSAASYKFPEGVTPEPAFSSCHLNSGA